MDYTPLIYDAAAALLIVICLIKGAKDGFAKTFVQTAGAIFSVIAATVVSRICASLIYTTAIQPAVLKSLETSLDNAVDTQSVTESLELAVKNLPAISRLLFDFDSAAEKLTDSFGLSSAKIAAQVEEGVISPVVMPLLETILFIVVLIILLFVVRLLAKGSKGFNDVPVVGAVNGFFGGVLGTANGIIVCIAVCAVLRIILVSRGANEWLSEDIISRTYLFKWIYGIIYGDTLSV